MTTKDPIREAFDKWALKDSAVRMVLNKIDDSQLDTILNIEIKAWRAALSLIPHAAEILSGEAKVVNKQEYEAFKSAYVLQEIRAGRATHVSQTSLDAVATTGCKATVEEHKP